MDRVDISEIGGEAVSGIRIRRKVMVWGDTVRA
jgi:hypothetical protein